MDETALAPKLTDTLVSITKGKQKERDDMKNNSENDSEANYDSNNTLDNIV